MREIDVSKITEVVSRLCIDANLHLPSELEQLIKSSKETEQSKVGKNVFCDLLDNIDVADKLNIPICQDTGMAVICAEVGQDDLIVGGSFEDAVNKGVSEGYTKGLLRKSIVSDPLERVNTNDNTPAVIHTRLTSGDKIKLTVAPKGFGSENMSAFNMMTPSATDDDIVRYVTQVVSDAGSNPCPPIVVGVGIGGDFEYCAYLAKKALCRDVSVRNPKERYANLEARMLESINKLGIGPQGFGGTVTALAVNIEQSATHIAGLPIAVNIGCHVTRHASEII